MPQTVRRRECEGNSQQQVTVTTLVGQTAAFDILARLSA